MLLSSNSPRTSPVRSNSTQLIGHPDVSVVPDDAAHAARKIHEVLVQPLDQNAGNRHQNAAGELQVSEGGGDKPCRIWENGCADNSRLDG